MVHSFPSASWNSAQEKRRHRGCLVSSVFVSLFVRSFVRSFVCFGIPSARWEILRQPISPSASRCGSMDITGSAQRARLESSFPSCRASYVDIPNPSLHSPTFEPHHLFPPHAILLAASCTRSYILNNRALIEGREEIHSARACGPTPSSPDSPAEKVGCVCSTDG